MLRKLLRSLQVFFPFLQGLKYRLRFAWMRFSRTPHEADFKAMAHLKPTHGQQLIDIGANRGEAITSMQIIVGNTYPIVGFEPNAVIFRKLKEYLARYENVKLHQVGLGNNTDAAPLYVPFYRHWVFDGLASFHYENAKNWLKGRLFWYRERFLQIKKTPCLVKTLDQYDLQPFFIKIDVQGYEMEVLQGSQETIEKNRPVLLVESIDQACLKFLSTLGYRPFYYLHGKFIPGEGKPNTYCLHTEQHQYLF